MEWRYVIGPTISFVAALIAFMALAKYRLKATEEETRQQRKDIQANKDDNHRLELLIKDNENDSNSKAMVKMAEALLLVAESNSKFQPIIEAQTELIKKTQEAIIRSHSRLDKHIEDNVRDLDKIKEDYVSHKYFDDVVGGN